MRLTLVFLCLALSNLNLLCQNAANSKVEICRNSYDYNTKQKPVTSHSQLDSILSFLPSITAPLLPKDYCKLSQANSIFDAENKQYYVIEGTAIFQYIVGHFRIEDLLSKDTFYRTNIDSLPHGIKQYWLMDKEELHKFLDLILILRSKGYNDSALTINHGHRNPAYNTKVGGVAHSYHLQGKAIDIKIGDINRDGKADSSDKSLVLSILENEVIGDKGGIGLYPNTDILHFDVRGYKARWNQH
jgi:hypothetical protein